MGDPAAVARLVASLMSARHPRARYLVGNDAQAAALAERFTPTFVQRPRHPPGAWASELTPAVEARASSDGYDAAAAPASGG